MGAIDNTKRALQQTQAGGDNQQNAPVTGQAASVAGSQSEQSEEGRDIENGYQEFSEEQGGKGAFNQSTWNQYTQQLSSSVGQNGGSLDASALQEAQQDLKNPNQHNLPAGTELQLPDSSMYTVKASDRIDFDSLPSGTKTRAPNNTPGYSQGFVDKDSSSNPLNPQNQGESTGERGKPSKPNYYASLYDMSNPQNPASPYNSLNMASAYQGTNDTGPGGSTGATDDNEDTGHKTTGTKGKD